jgi:single-strand selective monofunctional uracil DNA glycosylase
MELLEISRDLSASLSRLRFGAPTTHVYDPLDYAWGPHSAYLERYGAARPREVLLLGMNPGPFGMAQCGVPFGEIASVRGWLGVEAPVGKPAVEHPKRPIEGFGCKRSEVSGARLWGWARDTFGTPEAFFARFFVANYCPLVFMEESGKNRTPDKLPTAEREPLFAACDRAVLRTIEHLRPRFVIGVGKFAEDRLAAILAGHALDVTLGRVPHPSPASPLANGGWSDLMTRSLQDLGVLR